MRHFAWLLLYLCLCLTAQAADKLRTWTNIQGRTMQAEFLREVDGDVTFLKDGKLITIALDQLSEVDRKVIRELEASQRADDTTPRDLSSASNPFQPVPPGPTGGSDARPLPLKKKVAIADRIWTNTQGSQTTARFVRVVGPNVVLLRGNRTLTLPFDTLTSADQDYVREVLLSRGEEALIPQPAAPAEQQPADAGQSPANPPAAGTTPPSEPAQPDDPKLGRGNSDFFDQLRERDEQTRQEQAHAAVANQRQADQRPMDPQPQALQPRGEALEAGSLASGASSGSTTSGGVRTTLDPAEARDVRGAVIIVVVAVGVIGTVGVIVFIAISIAAASGGRRPRRYTA